MKRTLSIVLCAILAPWTFGLDSDNGTSEILRPSDEHLLPVPDHEPDVLLLRPHPLPTILNDSVPQPRQASNDCNYLIRFPGPGYHYTFYSPNYPNSYTDGIDCKWQIVAPTGYRASLRCAEFNVESTTNCVKAAFKVSVTGNTNQADSYWYCGKGTLSIDSNSGSNSLVVGFTTQGTPPTNDVYKWSCTASVSSDVTTTTAAPTSGCVCGVKKEHERIVNGQEAMVNEWPWQCGLYTDSRGLFCGCSIISDQWVLSAAHCTSAINGEAVYVVIGDHDLNSASETTASQFIAADSYRQHELFNSTTVDNDIAVLHLSRKISFSLAVHPACLPYRYANYDFAGQVGKVAGWGTTYFGGASSNILLETELDILTTTQCRDYLGNLVTNNMFCCYRSGTDSCQGDSGGPLNWQSPSGRYYQIGIVSWGIGCAQDKKPGAYTKLTNYLQWIQVNTGANFCYA